MVTREKEREELKRERKQKVKRIKYIILVYNCATVPSYIYDGTIAHLQDHVMGYFCTLMLKYTKIWHMENQV